MKTPEIKQGSILISKPFWMNEEYKHSVILIVAVSDEDGNVAGLILNKPSTLPVNEALPELNKIPSPMFYGGNNQIKSVSYIHSNPNVPDAVKLGEGVYWGGDYERLTEMINNNEVDAHYIRFMAGFVNWASMEDLKNEIKEDKWWVFDATVDLFDCDAEHLWSEELLTNGVMYGVIGEEIPDPVMN